MDRSVFASRNARRRDFHVAAAIVGLTLCVSDAVSDGRAAPKVDTPEGRYVLDFKHEYGSERLPHREISDSCRVAARKALQPFESPTVTFGPGVLVNSEEWVLDSNNGKEVRAHRPVGPPYSMHIAFFRARPRTALAVIWYRDASTSCLESLVLYGLYERAGRRSDSP